MGEIRLETLVTGSFVENGYILHREGQSEAVLIDPGAEPQRWLKQLDGMDLTPSLVLATHAHLDHVGAAAAIQKEHDCAFRLHKEEEVVLESLDWQCDLFGIKRITPPRVTGHVADSVDFEAAGIRFVPIASPGHTPGSTCYHVPEISRVFTGDTLFAGTVGRTDLPGGDPDQIVRSLSRLCSMLNDDTVVLPGHGPKSTIGRERTSNPFFRVEKTEDA